MAVYSAYSWTLHILEYALHGIFGGLGKKPQYVLITGTVTNVCCESSARDAMMLNFRTVMVSDGNAAMTDAEHSATLATFYAIFGDVMDTDFLVGCLERNAGRRAA